MYGTINAVLYIIGEDSVLVGNKTWLVSSGWFCGSAGRLERIRNFKFVRKLSSGFHHNQCLPMNPLDCDLWRRNLQYLGLVRHLAPPGWVLGMRWCCSSNNCFEHYSFQS